MREEPQWREQRGPGEGVGFLSFSQKQTWTNKYMRGKRQRVPSSLASAPLTFTKHLVGAKLAWALQQPQDFAKLLLPPRATDRRAPITSVCALLRALQQSHRGRQHSPVLDAGTPALCPQTPPLPRQCQPWLHEHHPCIVPLGKSRMETHRVCEQPRQCFACTSPRTALPTRDKSGSPAQAGSRWGSPVFCYSHCRLLQWLCFATRELWD